MLLSSAFSPVWDLTIYLGTLQVCLLASYFQMIRHKDVAASSHRLITIFIGFTVAVFWLTWGGYGVDAWRTLGRFDSVPRFVHGEYLFWLTGRLLGLLIADPWPLKILSAVASLVLVVSYGMATNSRERLLFSFIVMLSVPAFLLLYGNAVRQGVAGSLVILAGVLWINGRRRYAALPVIAAILSHMMSILPAMTLLAAVVLRKFVLPLFLLSYLVSPIARMTAEAFGLDLDKFVRYSSYQEGDFHFTKVIVAAMLSTVALVSLRRSPSDVLCFREIYLFLVIASNCLLIYEVPFERMLLFADLALPLMLAEAVYHEPLSARIRCLVTLTLAIAGVLIWSSSSITRSLGYAIS